MSETFILDYLQDLPSQKEKREECAHYLTAIPLLFKKLHLELGGGLIKPLPSIQRALAIELNQLPTHLRYAYLG